MGDRRGETLRSFWGLPPAARVAAIGATRGGGSMAEEVYRAVVDHAQKDRLHVLEECEVEHARWRDLGGDGDGGAGCGGGGGGEGVGGDEGCDGVFDVRFTDGSSDTFDYIWLATGGQPRALTVTESPRDTHNLHTAVLNERPLL